MRSSPIQWVHQSVVDCVKVSNTVLSEAADLVVDEVVPAALVAVIVVNDRRALVME